MTLQYKVHWIANLSQERSASDQVAFVRLRERLLQEDYPCLPRNRVNRPALGPGKAELGSPRRTLFADKGMR